MSHALIARSPDLRKLQESGHAIRVQDGYLIVDDVPYLTATKQVARGSLVLKLDLSGERTVQPSDHVAFWSGEFPHDANGQKLVSLGESTCELTLQDGTRAHFMLSARPKDPYPDFERKVLTYIAILGQEARQIDGSVSAQSWRVEKAEAAERVFLYLDTASARQNTSDLSQKLAGEKVAIIGVGGTGSYVLDLVAKTWVREIHLYDEDRFIQHNAFRAPGAFAREELEGGPYKVGLHAARYGVMRTGIVPHPEPIDQHNVAGLSAFQTVFLCIDGGPVKEQILRVCEQEDILCIDTGMGLYRGTGLLGGILRTTTSAPSLREHARKRIDMGPAEDGEYDRNIQMAELNALNAALAVVRWKKIRSIYLDLGGEGNAEYSVEMNRIVNRDGNAE